jgi:hypothetical protein
MHFTRECETLLLRIFYFYLVTNLNLYFVKKAVDHIKSIVLLSKEPVAHRILAKRIIPLNTS